MIKILLYSFLLFMCLLGSGNAQDQRFFETLYDIPIMQGLVEVEDMALSFDKAGGRIAEAGAKTDSLSDREVLSFYDTALSQMGWTRVEATYAPYLYMREGEKLSIFVEKSEGSTIYRFLLEPKEG